jgi:hypothetical protein
MTIGPPGTVTGGAGDEVRHSAARARQGPFSTGNKRARASQVSCPGCEGLISLAIAALSNLG